MKESIKNIVESLITIVVVLLIIIGYAKYAENQRRDNLKKSNVILGTEDYTSNMVDSSYNKSNNLKVQSRYGSVTPQKNILILILCASFVMFIISYGINKQMKTKEYRRETEGLLSPILAEAVIDRKIGLKELIMTSIIQLSIKGNIKIINNQTIELISKENLEEYEKGVIELLFKNSDRIEFKDVNAIFTSSNRETLNFTKKLSEIKEAISNKIISLKIFSKNITIVNQIIGLFATLICINLPQIFLNMEYIKEIKFIFWTLSALIIWWYIKKNINNTTLKEEIVKKYKRNEKKGSNSAILEKMAILVMVIINIAKCNMEFKIITLLILLLNIYVIHKSKKNILTEKGKKEQLELIKLKNYITEYSLMKDRDLNSVIIWDEYLAYATAFGIPSKITNSIYEGWYNMNLDLQIIDLILR